MTTDEALRAYNSLAGVVFSRDNRKWRHQEGAFKATTLEKKVQELVAEKNLGEHMLDTPNQSDRGKVFVCAMAAMNFAHPRLFRTYRVRELASINCKIWEAARATTATPSFFKRISIAEEGHAKEEFVDASIGCGNPVNQVLEEARTLFGNERTLGCLVSIGTGRRRPMSLGNPDMGQNLLPTKLIGALRDIATDCEETASRLSERFKNTPNLYFRFNVVHGAEGVSPCEWEKMGDLAQHAKAYMADPAVSKAIDEVVKILCDQSHASPTLGDLCQ
jgi:predicted acylesterase/phospholipase RssA